MRQTNKSFICSHGKVSRIFTIYLLFLMLSSGCSLRESRIIGEYEIRGTVVLRDRTSKVKVYPRLFIKGDKTFELRLFVEDDMIKGTWDVISSKSIHEGIVQFAWGDKKINVLLKGKTFYFRYPNDFYGGKFETLQYIKYEK